MGTREGRAMESPEVKNKAIVAFIIRYLVVLGSVVPFACLYVYISPFANKANGIGFLIGLAFISVTVSMAVDLIAECYDWPPVKSYLYFRGINFGGIYKIDREGGLTVSFFFIIWLVAYFSASS